MAYGFVYHFENVLGDHINKLFYLLIQKNLKVEFNFAPLFIQTVKDIEIRKKWLSSLLG